VRPDPFRRHFARTGASGATTVAGRSSATIVMAVWCAPDDDRIVTVRVLVVEDDPGMADLLVRALAREGHAVDHADNGVDALWAATERAYDAVVLDAMIPAPDGFEVCRRLRAAGRWMPILMLTARDRVDDRVAGLDAGADDYLTKPFALAELFARLRVLLRRPPTERPAVLRVGDLVLDPATHQVSRGDEPLDITPKAFAVLEYLMRNPGRVVTRTDLLDHAWDEAFDGESNVVDAYVKRVRDVIDRPGEASRVETVRGVGYRMRLDERP
jgi:two-component system OmpR family response regulator